MEQIAVSDFRANLMSFLKRAERGETLTITSRGHTVAKLVPPENKTEKSRAALKKIRKTAIVGDVLTPVRENWEAME